MVQRIKYPNPSKFDKEASISDCDLKSLLLHCVNDATAQAPQSIFVIEFSALRGSEKFRICL